MLQYIHSTKKGKKRSRLENMQMQQKLLYWTSNIRVGRALRVRPYFSGQPAYRTRVNNWFRTGAALQRDKPPSSPFTRHHLPTAVVTDFSQNKRWWAMCDTECTDFFQANSSALSKETFASAWIFGHALYLSLHLNIYRWTDFKLFIRDRSSLHRLSSSGENWKYKRHSTLCNKNQAKAYVFINTAVRISNLAITMGLKLSKSETEVTYACRWSLNSILNFLYLSFIPTHTGYLPTLKRRVDHISYAACTTCGRRALMRVKSTCPLESCYRRLFLPFFFRSTLYSHECSFKLWSYITQLHISS
jgi:hypothetical protein